MSDSKKHLVLVDPGARTAELDCFNRIARHCPLPVTYHLPALYGTAGLLEENPDLVAGVIILGSSTSILDEPSWQQPLLDWSLRILQANRPVFGICYAHQLFAHHFGGKVEFLTEKHDKREGLHSVSISRTEFFSNSSKVPMLFSHRELVTHCPKEMSPWASSQLSQFEGLNHKRLPLWTVQFHPEATQGFLENQKIAGVEIKQLSHGHNLVDQFLAILGT